jgi:hypothetical protein
LFNNKKRIFEEGRVTELNGLRWEGHCHSAQWVSCVQFMSSVHVLLTHALLTVIMDNPDDAVWSLDKLDASINPLLNF